ncbi:MAG TPA: hypothetical protein VGD87_15370 [Archangium sp.]
MDDLSRLTLRELLTLARERLGSAASHLKTRDEVLSALTGSKPPPPAPQVASDFFSPKPAMSPSTPARPPLEVVTRDFFRKR